MAADGVVAVMVSAVMTGMSGVFLSSRHPTEYTVRPDLPIQGPAASGTYFFMPSLDIESFFIVSLDIESFFIVSFFIDSSFFIESFFMSSA
jgi:hypothetical protein